MRRAMMVRGLAAAFALALWPVASAAGQAERLAARVKSAPDGSVRLSFAARPGVCGDGHNVSFSRHERDELWESDCEHGPVRVALAVRGGRVTDVEMHVGGRWRSNVSGVTELGTVPAADAAGYLLDLAGRLDGKAGREAILPAVLADSVEVWPKLIRLARDESRPRQTRKSAIFWLGQAAGSKVTEELGSIAADAGVDRDVRATAIFALSQQPNDEGVPALIRIARSHPDPELRKKALFWLAQSEDERAIALFEEILTGH